MIIDGYNVIHRVPHLKTLLNNSLESARTGLFRYCTNWHENRKDIWIFYVVFDGSSNVQGYSHQPALGVRVVYTKTNETADTRILELINERIHDCKITVVSDDNFVKRHSRLLNAKIMSTTEFAGVIPKMKNAPHRQANVSEKKLTPSEEKQINDSLRQSWNID